VSGPWIQTVVLCRRAGGEACSDGALDILDTIATDAGAQVDLDMMIALVRGDWQGAITLNVQAHDPAGEPIAAMEVQGDPPAIPYAVSRIVVPIELVPTQPGVYWFDVRTGDEPVGPPITRVPLRIDWQT
jgi:hypothetical protein